MQVLEKVARAMSSKYDVNVVFRGGKAYTNGRTIVLPALPDDMSEEDLTVARGYGDHEVGHVKHTDFEALRAQVGEDKKLHSVWNYLEDLMIERKQSEEFPGARDNMNFLVNWLVAKGELDMDHPLMKLFIEGRRALCGYDIPALPSYRKELETLFGSDFFERLARANSTHDNIDHARRMIGHYESDEEREEESSEHEERTPSKSEEREEEQSDDRGNEASGQSSGEEEKEEESDQGSEQSDESKDDHGDGSGEEHEEESEEQSNDDQGSMESDEEENDEAGDDQGAGEGSGDDGEKRASSENGGEPEDYEESEERDGKESESALSEGRKSADKPNLDEASDPFDKIREYIEGRHVEALTSAREYMVYSREKDVLEPMEEAKTLSAYNRLKDDLGSLNALRGKVQSLFLARTQSRWLNDREEGRINPRALAKLTTGNARVFRERFVSKDRDTAVSFLVDYSGSMRGYALDCAMRAAVCFLEALEGSKVKSECLTFTTGETTYDYYEFHQDPNYGEYGRVEALDMKIIKSFDEPYGAKVKRRISGYRKCSNRNNCDGDSVQIAAQRLLARPEKRKILFVLTDGLVGNYGNVERGMAFLKKICQDCERAGIELIGIGLNVRDLARYYPRTIDIKNASDLPAHLFKELRRIFKV